MGKSGAVLPLVTLTPPPRKRHKKQQDDPSNCKRHEGDCHPPACHLPPPHEDGRKCRIGLTKYERVRILGARATELTKGAVPLVPVSGVFDPLEIAQEELRRGLIKTKLVRARADGEREVWTVEELLGIKGVSIAGTGEL